MRLRPEEPSGAPWQQVPLPRLIDRFLPHETLGRTVVVAVDGRGGGGKTTLASGLAAATGAPVVHTDDVAWEHSFFGWHRLLAHHVLEPVRAGRAVSWTPPRWTAHGRSGAIEVAAGLPVLIVEGTGIGARVLTPLIDVLLWVQTDHEESDRRGIARDVELGRTLDEARRFWQEWMAEEVPFLATERPWDRADAVVHGSPGPLPPGMVLVGG